MSKRDIRFSQKAWQEYLAWHKVNRKIFTKLNRLIEAIFRDPFSGVGKPESLRENMAGYWSRRIDDEHRIVYKVTDTEIRIAQCRFHYIKK